MSVARRALGVAALALGFVALVLGVGGARAGASGSTLTGEGESWPQPVIAVLVNDSAAAVSPFTVDYNFSVGEDPGRQAFAAGTADFAVTEAALSSAELSTTQHNGRTVGYVPYAEGAVAIIVALDVDTAEAASSGVHGCPSRIQQLDLTVPTLAKIFTHEITAWNDPEILGENPNDQCLKFGYNSGDTIQIVVRTDSSSETSQLIALFLSDPQARSIWDGYATTHGVPADTPVDRWPGDLYGEGSGSFNELDNGDQGVLDLALQLEPGTRTPKPSTSTSYIAYTGAAWAQAYRAAEAGIQNRAGSYVTPSADAIAQAIASGATFDSSTNLVSIDPTKITAAGAYPIPLVSYLAVPVTGLPTDKATALKAFVHFVLSSQGQADVSTNGYVPVSQDLITGGANVDHALLTEATPTTTASSSTTSSTTSSTSSTLPTTTGNGVGSAGVTTTTALASGQHASGASSTPTPPRKPAVARTDPSASQLPFTGGPGWLLVVVGVLLVGGGQIGNGWARRARA